MWMTGRYHIYNNDESMQFVIDKLQAKYTVKVVDDPKMFRGIQIYDSPGQESAKLRIDQASYLEEVAAKHGLCYKKAPPSPGPTNLMKIEDEWKGKEPASVSGSEIRKYMEVQGCLQWAKLF